jgi:hypothetical protein
MTLTTRLLETGFETKFHALQIIFVRMLCTGIISSAYMCYKQTPGFPLGPPGVRWLLVIRGLAGTVGLIGLYCTVLPILKPPPFSCVTIHGNDG